MAKSTAERAIAIGKDLALFMGGLAGIAYQQITDNVNVWLLVVFTLMTGVPGVTNLISLLRGSAINSLSSELAPPRSESESDKYTLN